MGQQADITVFDGAATPVSHTLTGEGIERMPDGALKAVWKENLASVPDEAQVRYIQLKRKLPSGVIVTNGRVIVPVMETISGANAAGYTAAGKIAYFLTYSFGGYAHGRSTSAERKLARGIAVNIQRNYGASATYSDDGAWPYLNDALIQVT